MLYSNSAFPTGIIRISATIGTCGSRAAYYLNRPDLCRGRATRRGRRQERGGERKTRRERRGKATEAQRTRRIGKVDEGVAGGKGEAGRLPAVALGTQRHRSSHGEENAKTRKGENAKERHREPQRTSDSRTSQVSHPIWLCISRFRVFAFSPRSALSRLLAWPRRPASHLAALCLSSPMPPWFIPNWGGKLA
jgi:hypothetical protein